MNTKKHSALEMGEALKTSEAFLHKYKKAFIIGFIAILVVIGLIVGAHFWLKQRENKAQSLLTLGQTYLAAEDYSKALNGEGKFPGYIKIASQYSFTKAANLANMYAGICYAKEGKTGEAIKYLEKFSNQGDHTISPAAIAALANCYANNNQLEKAVDKFKEAAKLADNASMSPEYLIQAGELLTKMNNKTEANKIFKEIKEKYPQSKYCMPSQSPNGTFTDPLIDSQIELSGK